MIYYESRPIADVPRFARCLAADTGDSLDDDQLRDAVKHLQCRGLVAVVDRAFQCTVESHLARFKGYGPTEGIPDELTLDFTLLGAQLWRNFLAEDPVRDIWNGCTSFVYRRSSTMVYTTNSYWAQGPEWRDDPFRLTPVGPLQPIEEWRIQWWHEIPTGFRQLCLPLSKCKTDADAD